MFPVTSLFSPVLLMNQRQSPPLRVQASHCSTSRIMCDVPSTAIFCTESIECSHCMSSKFFFKTCLTIPVAPAVFSVINNFMFYIRCISVHRRLYFSFFSASFCVIFLSAGAATLSVVLIIISVLFAVSSLSLCTAWFRNNVTSSRSHLCVCVCVHAICLSFPCRVLCIFSDVNTQQLCRLSFLGQVGTS